MGGKAEKGEISSSRRGSLKKRSDKAGKSGGRYNIWLEGHNSIHKVAAFLKHRSQQQKTRKRNIRRED